MTEIGEIVKLREQYEKAIEQGKKVLNEKGYFGDVKKFRRKIKEMEYQRNELYKKERHLRQKLKGEGE